MIKKLLPSLLAILLTCPVMAEPTPWPTTAWSVASPEAEGMDPGKLADLVQWAKLQKADSILVVRHGKIVLDTYYAPFKPGIRHDLRSITKSFTSTLVAIAIRDHLLDSVDHPVLDLFKEKNVANVDDQKKAITVQHLLDMTAGFEWTENGYGPEATLNKMYRSTDKAKFVLDQPMKTIPGQSFYYNSGNPYILSALLTKLTGKNALDYAKVELFGPLGIRDVDWAKPDAQNVIDGESQLFLQPLDMAKLGYLYLHNGEWDGKQIIPAEWVQRTSVGIVKTNARNGSSYANLWWAFPQKKAYLADGRHGQRIIVIPSADILAVVTASLPDGQQETALEPLIDKVLAGVKGERDLPADPSGTSLLQSALRDAAAEVPDIVGKISPLAKEISGKSYDFDANNLNLKEMMFDFAGPEPSLSIAYEGVKEMSKRPIGLKGVFPEEQTTSSLSRAKGRWLTTDSFELSSRSLGQSITNRWVFRFKGDKIDVHLGNGDGFRGEAHGVMHPLVANLTGE